MAIQDITSQKKFSQELELQVRQRTKELKDVNSQLMQSNENLQQFASIASHDLQEPLRKIRTFTELLNQRYVENLPVEGREIVNKIKSSSDRMSQLIKEVLQYSKVVHSHELFVNTDLNLILKNVINDLDLLISETNADIIYKDNLPKVDAIPLQMNQLFYNLLINALKFHNHSEKPVIEISYKMLSADEINSFEILTVGINYIKIKFADNGIGFEQQFADQIFQLFERLHSAEDYEGTGVGLALCKKIVEIHHGHIFALAEENKGASFQVILPVKQ